MDQVLMCGEWLADAFVALWNSIGTWGIFGLGIVAPAVLVRIAYLLKKVFKF